MPVVKRNKILTASLTFKVTPAEEKQIAGLAAEAGQSKSEWLRRTVLCAVTGAPDTHLIVGEVLAARVILCALLSRVANGKQITKEEIDQLGVQVDTGLAKMADGRIRVLKGGAK